MIRLLDCARDLESRGDVELAECVAQVRFDRLGAEVEGGGDLSVRLAVGDEPPNLEFASGERGHAGCVRVAGTCSAVDAAPALPEPALRFCAEAGRAEAVEGGR
jgi:hypothetical protein